ncbi:MAG: GDSL-type esterase/lipase family protein [Candidatus Omnitrophica bacterium]|nr:GDSL-type esterase/lipase family protein [Candidatus Omnitrophota bacterium]
MKRDRSQKSEVRSQIFLFSILCLLFSVLLTGCVSREIKNIESSGTNIICFGDSITFGYGADGGGDYPSHLSKMLTIPVINAGLDGDTTTGGLTRLEKDVLEKKPLLVIIEFGGNDFLKKIPMEVTIENISSMVERIQQKGVMVAIADISAGIFLREYGTAFKKIAREKQAIFIPNILSGIITNPSMKSDFIHPNANGYKIIAFRVYREIRPYLNKNILLRGSDK